MHTLEEHAASIKLRFLAMYKAANAGHVGSSLSCAEILTFVRFAWMQGDDRLVVSKGHAAAAVYALLVESGDLPAAELATFYQDGTRLAAHPPPGLCPLSPFATGSLGHGLSLAAGLALGAKMQGKRQKVFCVTSDGELNEGSIWEAALFAAHHELKNLIWLVDRNGLQGFGRTEDVVALEPLSSKLAAFGMTVLDADGHDFRDLERARAQLEGAAGPVALVCRTLKGHGIQGLEATVASHYLPMSDEQYAQITAEVGGGKRAS
jgi:transketolase